MTKRKNEEVMLLTNDYVFKRVFGHKGSEKITKALIGEIIGRKIRSIKLSESPILEKDLKLDNVKVVLDDMTIIDVEMQVRKEKGMEQRRMFYISKLLVDQIQESEQYELLNKVIYIEIEDYKDKKFKNRGTYHIKAKYTYDDKEHEEYSNMVEIHEVNLRKLEEMRKRGEIDKEDKLAIWGKLIKNPKRMKEEEMEKVKETIDVQELLKRLEGGTKERWLAEQRLKYIRDMKGIRAEGYDAGLTRGEKRGRKARKRRRNRKQAKRSNLKYAQRGSRYRIYFKSCKASKGRS